MGMLLYVTQAVTACGGNVGEGDSVGRRDTTGSGDSAREGNTLGGGDSVARDDAGRGDTNGTLLPDGGMALVNGEDPTGMLLLDDGKSGGRKGVTRMLTDGGRTSTGGEDTTGMLPDCGGVAPVGEGDPTVMIVPDGGDIIGGEDTAGKRALVCRDDPT